MSLPEQAAAVLEAIAEEREKLAAAPPPPAQVTAPEKSEDSELARAVKEAGLVLSSEAMEKIASDPELSGAIAKLSAQALTPTPLGGPSERNADGRPPAPKNAKEAVAQANDRFENFLLRGGSRD
jgi:hypothetical protein